jgi:hypothetical protein
MYFELLFVSVILVAFLKVEKKKRVGGTDEESANINLRVVRLSVPTT